MTEGRPEDWHAVQRACAAWDLSWDGARLIHHYSSAIYLLPRHNAVARVSHGRDAAAQADRSQAVTRWLVRERGFPATEPLGQIAPVTVTGAVVTFWRYYPQPVSGPELTSAHLARVLRELHGLDRPPIVLPDWIPLDALHATIEDADSLAVLSSAERAWIRDRIAQVREQIADLDWPLGTGLIHGDAWAGNLLARVGAEPGSVVLGDWDWVSIGPREVDVVPTWHAATRYGKGPAWISDFVDVYGYDLAAWKGYPVLLAMRDLVQLNGPIRRARKGNRYFKALRQRLDSIVAGDNAIWSAL